MRSPIIKPVEETNIGMYVWEMPDGRWVGDDEGRFMYIRGRRGDLAMINKLADAARAYGINEGRAVFLSGRRPVTDEEYEEQRQRLVMGLNPDPQDYYAQLDELKYGRSPE